MTHEADIHTVFLGLGSNLGDKKKNLDLAIEHIRKYIGDVTDISTYYHTDPVGFDSVNSFLNAVCCVRSIHSANKILEITQNIEKDMGRNSKSINQIYSDRTIDIDILLFDENIINSPTLTIPHLLMHKRIFVLDPLTEIAPHTIHPVLKETIVQLKGRLNRE